MPIKQDHRLIAIHTPLGADVLGLRSFSLQEQLGRLFQIEAELSSENGDIDLDKVVGHNVTLRLKLPGQATRYFNGFVSRLVQIANQGGYAHYRATIVPWLWFLTRNSDCRVWAAADQPSAGKTIPDILEEVFKLHGFSDYKLSLTATYPKREFVVQYRETDFNFVSRLMEQGGIYYFFEHENGKHTLVLADSISAHKPFPGYAEVKFLESASGHPGEEVISDWTLSKEAHPVATALTDYDFQRPKASLLSNTNVSRPHGKAQFEIFDFPGEFLEAGEGERLAQTRLDELQCQYEVLHGQTTARGLCAGYLFSLEKHPRGEQNRDYLVTGVSLHADAGEFASKGAGQPPGDYFSCSLTALDKTQQFRPARLTPKPLVQGVQTALVTGPKGEEIHTDKYGRVKAQFHWDRYGKFDQNSSCWIRVAQGWAGKKWGAIFIPRISQEVVVEFLEGDPDRPLITGSVYNDEQKVPYDLPADKTKSTVKSNSSKGGSGFNELRFEDASGSEQIFLHAERDFDQRVKQDCKEQVQKDRHLTVGSLLEGVGSGNQYELVHQDKHLTVKQNQIEQVGGNLQLTIGGINGGPGNLDVDVKGIKQELIEGDNSLHVKGDRKEGVDGAQSLTVGGDQQEKITGNHLVSAGKQVYLKAGTTLVLEATTQLSLVVGGNFIDIGPAGVSIKGTMVMINSGGSAASGAASSPTAPVDAAPGAPTAPKDADDAKSGQKSARS